MIDDGDTIVVVVVGVIGGGGGGKSSSCIDELKFDFNCECCCCNCVTDGGGGKDICCDNIVVVCVGVGFDDVGATIDDDVGDLGSSIFGVGIGIALPNGIFFIGR